MSSVIPRLIEDAHGCEDAIHPPQHREGRLVLSFGSAGGEMKEVGGLGDWRLGGR